LWDASVLSQKKREWTRVIEVLDLMPMQKRGKLRFLPSSGQGRLFEEARESQKQLEGEVAV
jgi:hypothetical protein